MSPKHPQEVICPIPSCDQLYTGSRAKDSLRDHMFTSSSKCEEHFKEYKDRYPFARREPGTVYPCRACSGVFGKTSCLKRHMEKREYPISSITIVTGDLTKSEYQTRRRGTRVLVVTRPMLRSGIWWNIW